VTVFSRVTGRLAHLGPAGTRQIGVERDLPMTAAPGVVLLADRWYPLGVPAPSLPVVLLRSPYGRRQLGGIGRLIAERGFQVVIQSCRGTFGSGGDWEPFRHEQADGRRALEWLADQAWWSGTVGTFGASYLGFTQWAVATDPPPPLGAVALNVTASRFRDIVVYPGGSFTLETGATWMYLLAHQELGWRRIVLAQLRARRRLAPAFSTLPLAKAEQAVVGREVGYYQDWLAHDRLGDPWWDAVDFSRDVTRVPPATLTGGWYDIFLPAQVDDYVALRAAGRDVRLTIGPWTHASLAQAAAALRDGLDWFDRHLRPDASPRRRRSPVRLYVLGRDQWVDLDSWPPPAVVQPWYLHADGRLDRARPASSAPDRYRYDPAQPTPSAGGPSLNATTAGPRNQRRREQRADVLTYTSTPLPVTMTIAGPLHAELWVVPSREQTDVFVRLCVVSRRGRSTNFSDGILRMAPVTAPAPEPGGGGGPPSHRGRDAPAGVTATLAAPETVRRRAADGTAPAGGAPAFAAEVAAKGSPEWGSATREDDGTIHVRIRMWPTAVTVAAGESLRLQVSAGAHPLFARNLGSDEPLSTATTLIAVTHEVFHDPEHPSAIEIPLSSI
jgi:putative CocE/NonD family hydrolase